MCSTSHSVCQRDQICTGHLFNRKCDAGPGVGPAEHLSTRPGGPPRMRQFSSTSPTWVQACQAHSRGDLATATRLYRQLVTQEPQHIDALYRLGCIAYTQGRPALARVYLMQAAALQPTAAAIHSALGDVACALGDLATA